jgi:hypothetical protein
MVGAVEDFMNYFRVFFCVTEFDDDGEPYEKPLFFELLPKTRFENFNEVVDVVQAELRMGGYDPSEVVVFEFNPHTEYAYPQVYQMDDFENFPVAQGNFRAELLYRFFEHEKLK